MYSLLTPRVHQLVYSGNACCVQNVAKLKVQKQEVFTKPAAPPPNSLKRKQPSDPADAVVHKARRGECFSYVDFFLYTCFDVLSIFYRNVFAKFCVN